MDNIGDHNAISDDSPSGPFSGESLPYLFKNHRLLGSALPFHHPKRRLKSPTAKQLLAQAGPQPLETSLYDLLATFQEAYDKAVAESKRRPPQLHDPV